MVQRCRPAFSWLLALLLPSFAVYLALTWPIEEIAYDAAAIHIPRSVVFSASRAGGWVIPRWTSEMNAGLGSPVFSFYPPLPYLLMDLLDRLGIPHPIGWRLLVALALELASAGAFGLGLALAGRADVALAAAAGFAYAPYLLQELFERGSPQGMAIGLAPWVLWGLYRLWERPTGLRLAVAAAAWACLILVHNLTTILFAPFVAIFFVFLALKGKTGRRLLGPALALLAGTLLAGFHVIPFLIERQYIQLSYINQFSFELPADNPLLLGNLLALPHFFDVTRTNNGMGQTIGPLQAIILLLGVPVAIILWRQRRRDAAILLAGYAGWGLGLVWLQLPAATPVWNALPALNILQFRWRLLGMLAFATLAAAIYLLLECPESIRRRLAPALAIVFTGMQLPFIFPQLMHATINYPARPTLADIRTLANSTNLPGLSGFDEFLPIWRTAPLTEQEVQESAATVLADLPAGALVLREQRGPQWAKVSLDAPAAFTAMFRMLYYPGWQGDVDGQRQTVQPATGTGYLSLEVPPGMHTVTLQYKGTAVQHAGDLISLLAAVALLIGSVAWAPARREPFAWQPLYLRERWWVPAGLIVLAVCKGAWLDPSTTWLRCKSSATAVCGAQVSADASFVGGPKLRGFTVTSPIVKAGDYLRLEMYWEGTEASAFYRNSFVHVRNSIPNGPLDPETGSEIWAQGIHEMPGGTLVPGKLTMDAYQILIPAGTPPGEYYLEVGWFDPVTGEQLDVERESLQPPLDILWRSVLLPDIQVR